MSGMSPKKSGSVSRPTRKRSSASSTGKIETSTKPEDVTMSTKSLLEMANAVSSGAVRVVDLTFTLSPDFPVIVLPPEFGQAAPVRIQEISRYDGRGPAWYWNNVTFGEHTGTHFDAPIHWFTGKDLPNNAVDTMPAKDMIAPACVIDCSGQAAKDPDFLLTVPDVEAWEAKHGKIPTRHWVLLRTDWSKKGWRDYANLRDDGAHTPGPNPAVMKWLVEERGVIGFGTETIGTDAGQAGHMDPPYPAHHFLHGAGRYGLQCLCNLDQLPPTGAVIVASPLKIQNGSGSPLRVIALVGAS
ncbi:cyclase [Bradyrhizobium guangdongense]|nr:cyclase [Bradyrhizobium guangdongense]